MIKDTKMLILIFINDTKKTLGKILFPLCVIFLTHCSGLTVTQPLKKEDLVQRDNYQGLEFVPKLEKQLKIKQDIEVSVYLKKLADTLVSSTPELLKTPIGVILFQEKNHVWKNYSLPGNRVYLSLDLIKHLEFESELASAIAFELAHILNRHSIVLYEKNKKNLEENENGEFLDAQNKSIDFFSPHGIFAFSEENLLVSTEVCIGVLYRSGFDPRGIGEFWKKHLTNLKYSPYDNDTLNKLIEHSRQNIALYTPLRNPVVRSHKFISIQKKIQKL